MAEITTALIKELRETTGAGILESRNALQEAEGSLEKAVQLLRERGLAKAIKKADRSVNEGTIVSQLEEGNRLGAMIELNCETASPDALLAETVNGQTVQQMLTEAIATIGENIQLRRVARFAAANGDYITSYIHMGGRIGVLLEIGGADKTLAHDLALQIAASSPRYVHADEVPASVTDAERAIYKTQLAEDKKPEHIKDKIVQGKVDKFLDEIVLLRQPFIKDPNKTVQQLLNAANGQVGVRRFARFELGAE
jgi:elongation factor Ts